MGLIVINDGWNGTMNTEDLGNIRILCCNDNDVLEADVIVQVRDWLLSIYEGGYTAENERWTNRKALANAVIFHAIKHDKRFWVYLASEAYLSAQIILEDTPKFTYMMSEEEVPLSMSPP